MKYRRLGRTGIEVSEIGFGTWGIGGTAGGATAYGAADDRESKAALRRAFDLGVTFYDTSNLYGYGHSESLIGSAFKGLRKKVVLASKVGFGGAGDPQDFSPAHIRAAIEKSLKRLQTDYLDLYQLHSPPTETLENLGDILQTLSDLQSEGKVRALGVSVRSPEDGLGLVRNFKIPCLQVNFNLVDQRLLETGLMELCEREEVGLVCRTPLCFGFLGGGYSEESEFDSQDHRHSWPREQRALWVKAPRLFSPVRRTAGETPAQFALRFCLSYAPVSTVIPGMLKPEQVEENIRASALGPLSRAEHAQVEEIYRKNTFFLGKKNGPRAVV